MTGLNGTKPPIQMNQAYMLFLLASFSPTVRVATGLCAKLGKQAGWLSVALACLVFCGLILLLRQLFSRSARQSLADIYRDAYGPVFGSALIAVYLCWLFVLISLYVRAFAERFASSIMPSAPNELFVITMLAMCYLFLSGPFDHFMRTAGIYFYAVLICLGIIFLALLTKIQLGNVYPVTTLDALPVLKGSYPFLGIFCYITFVMLTADEVAGKERLLPLGLRSAVILLVTNQIVFFMTVGIFGSALTQDLTLPFFMSVKTINLFGTLGRLESLFLFLWVITDVAIITMLMQISLRLAEKLFHLTNPSPLKTPLLLGTYLFSLVFVNSFFEIAAFSEKIGLLINICLGIGVPAATLIIIQLRQLGRPQSSRSSK